MTETSTNDRIAVLERRLRRATAAREEAEAILERRARELLYLNEKLAAREDELLRRLDDENRHLLYAQRTAQIATFHRGRGQSLFTSPEFNRLLGLPTNQRPSEQSLLEVIHPLDRERVIREERSFYESAPAGTELSYDCRILRNGTTCWLRWVMRRENDAEGHFSSLFGSVQDITGQRRADRHARAMALIADRRVKQLTRMSAELAASQQETEKAYRAKSEFLAMMSHDIRTPLNGLLGMTEMLALGDLNPAQRERLDVAHDAATQLHRQIEEIVAMARGEHGRLAYVPQPVAIKRSLESLVRFWRVGRPEVGARLRLKLSDTLPEVIASDPTRLRQLLDAFIERLRSSDGEIVIRAGADAQQVRIAVAAAAAAQVGRARDRRSSDRKIIERLAESMDAAIEVETDARRIRYVLILTSAAVPTASAAQPYSAEQEIASGTAMAPLTCQGRRPVVLVADDVEINRFVLVQMLDAMGCDVDTAEDGREAVEKAGERRYDAILMDIRMPRMSGTEAMQMLRADSAGERLPIVAVTAHADAAELAELVAEGFDEALAKPVRSAQVAATLRALFEQAQTPPQPAGDEQPIAQPQPAQPTSADAQSETGTNSNSEIDNTHFLSIFEPLPQTRRQMLLDVAVADLQRLGGAIAQALEQDDAQALDHASHSLKGVAGNFGAFVLMDSIAEFRDADMAQAKVLLGPLQARIQAVIDEARALFVARGL
ncbi:multi-sensor hybrid histidine kinase [Salinisphaera sp. S4-8]|uniref:response regulator n=1 Tax=Salinisphaera sp. S4-8 TaxID=633357 RepID=UPI00334000B8